MQTVEVPVGVDADGHAKFKHGMEAPPESFKHYLIGTGRRRGDQNEGGREKRVGLTCACRLQRRTEGAAKHARS